MQTKIQREIRIAEIINKVKEEQRKIDEQWEQNKSLNMKRHY